MAIPAGPPKSLPLTMSPISEPRSWKSGDVTRTGPTAPDDLRPALDGSVVAHRACLFTHSPRLGLGQARLEQRVGFWARAHGARPWASGCGSRRRRIGIEGAGLHHGGGLLGGRLGRGGGAGAKRKP